MLHTLPSTARYSNEQSKQIKSPERIWLLNLSFATIISVAILLFSFQFSNAQSCSGFRTQTQGGWGAKPSGGNPGVYLHTNFDGAFQSGLTIGCTGSTITFTSAQAITDLLPTGGGPATIPAGNQIDPSSVGTVLVGQLVSAMLSVGFDLYDADFGSNPLHLQDLVIASGFFSGWTVSQLLTQANLEIGGCSSTYSLDEINTALDNINNDYDDGTSNHGFLNCPPTCNIGISATSINSSCHGSANGSINVTVTGAQGDVTYMWNDGVTTEDRSGLAPGTYTVTATDGGGCSATTSKTITQPDELGVSALVVNLTSPGSNDGSINVTVTGGTSPYHYLWNDGVTTEDRTGLSTGTYTVTVTDDHGCQAQKSYTITQPCSLNLSFTCKKPNCFGDASGGINITATGAQGDVTYLWNDGITTEDRSGLLAGTYTVTATGGAGCSAVLTKTIGQPAAVTINETHVDASASGAHDGSIDITATGGSGRKTYLWNDGVTKQDRFGLATGSYTVTVTDKHGCSSSATIEIGVQQNRSGISQMENASIKHYPNPAQNSFTLEVKTNDDSEQQINVFVENLLGQVVYSSTPEKFDGTYKKDISFDQPLTNGLYVIHVIAGNKEFTDHLVIQH